MIKCDSPEAARVHVPRVIRGRTHYFFATDCAIGRERLSKLLVALNEMGLVKDGDDCIAGHVRFSCGATGPFRNVTFLAIPKAALNKTIVLSWLGTTPWRPVNGDLTDAQDFLALSLTPDGTKALEAFGQSAHENRFMCFCAENN